MEVVHSSSNSSSSTGAESCGRKNSNYISGRSRCSDIVVSCNILALMQLEDSG